MFTHLAYRIVLTLSPFKSLVVVSVPAVAIGASQMTRTVSMGPALLGFTEIIVECQNLLTISMDNRTQ